MSVRVRYSLVCDSLGCGAESPRDDGPAAAMSKAVPIWMQEVAGMARRCRAAGWHAMVIGPGEWVAYCPECLEKGVKP